MIKPLRLMVVFFAVIMAGSVPASETAKVNKNELIKVSDALEIQPLGKDLWIHTSYHTLSNGQVFPGNGLMVRNERGVVLIDTAWGEENTKELVNWVEDSLGEPVAGALVTHFHSDSAGGAGVLIASGVPVFASRLTWENLEPDWQDSVQVIDGLSEPGGHRQELGVELFYAGPAHTVDNLFAWLPEQKALFGTCAVRSPVYPGQGNTADASVAEWAGTIKRARDRYPSVQVVVPGHGPAADSMLLQHTIEVFSQEASSNETD